MATEAEKKARAQKVFEKLWNEAPNKRCVDCPTHNPQWASVSCGTFLCIKCAGIHRGLGVHLSFVRSCSMDMWSPVQLERMKAGGNARMKEFWVTQKFSKSLSPLARYDNEAMEKYRAQILAEAKGGARAELPFIGYAEKKRVPKKMGGGMGSTSSGGGRGSNGRTNQRSGGGGRQSGFGGGGPSNNDTSDAWGDLLGSLGTSFSKGASAMGTAVTQGATVVGKQASQAAMYTRDKATQGFQSMQDEDALKDVSTKLKSGWSSMASWMSNTVSKIGNSTGAGNDDLSLYNKSAVGPRKPADSSNMKAYGSDQYFQRNQQAELDALAAANKPRTGKQMPSLGSASYFAKGQSSPTASSTQGTTSHSSSAVVVSKSKPRPAAAPKATRSKPAAKKENEDWGFDGFGDGKSKDDDDGPDWGGMGDLDEIAGGLDDVDISSKTSPESKPKAKKPEKASPKEDPGDDPDDWGWN